MRTRLDTVRDFEVCKSAAVRKVLLGFLLPDGEEEWEWIRQEARRLGTDGCTGGREVYEDACYLHDVCYRTHTLPVVVGTERLGEGIDEPRVCYVKLDREEADWAFAEVIRRMSPAGRWSPLAAARHLVVRLMGYWAWVGKGSGRMARRAMEAWIDVKREQEAP